MGNRLGDFIDPPIDKGIEDRLWLQIQERRERRPRWWLGALGLACACGALFGLFFQGAPEVDPSFQVRLAKGAKLLPCSEDGSCQSLLSGWAEFEVRPRTPGEPPFQVRAGNVTVSVVGTRFVVERRGNGVSVDVSEGRVIVASEGGEESLGAGDSWRATSVPESNPTGSSSASARAVADLPATPPSRGLQEASRSDDKPDYATTRRLRPTGSSNGGGVQRARRRPPSADELWTEFRSARKRGDSQNERRSLEQLVRLYPGHPRAGRSALILARLELDVFERPSMAVGHLRTALRRLEGGDLAMEARALLPRAHVLSGDLARCRRSRDRYLSLHPRGPHAEALRSVCGE